MDRTSLLPARDLRRELPLALALLAALVPACATPDDAPPVARTVKADGALTLATGLRARELLDDQRRELLARLEKASDARVDAVVDVRTQAVLSLALHIATAGDTLETRARGFLDVYQALLDPHIASSEYVVAATDPSCAASVVVFDRVIDGRPVAGSRLTLHFDDAHAIEAVTNGVASTPADVLDVDPKAIDGAQPLAALIPRDFEAKPTRAPVMVPAPDLRGVFAAELVEWTERADTASGRKPVAAIAVGDTAITGPLVVTTPVTDPPVKTPAAPQYLDRDGLPLPEFITYRPLGGVRVNHLPWEHDPTEMAYRFLEEHPSLARTFAARCQFAPRGLDEDAAAPGVYFVRLGQKFGPLPVFGSELVIMQEGLGNVASIAGRTLPSINAASAPTIAVTDAIAATDATLDDGAQRDPRYKRAVQAALAQPARVALGVLPAHKQLAPFGQQERLAYQVQRGGYLFYVDALTAKTIGSQTMIMPANIVTDAGGGNELSGTFVIDEVDGMPSGLVSPRNADNLPSRPGGNTGMSLAATAAFYASAGWLGIDGRGGDWVANTNVNSLFTPCFNAYFNAIVSHQAYFCLGAAANDVVAHELTHGVVAATSRLWFADQSGALNEAYADIMGNLAFPDTTPGDWQFGELLNNGTGMPWRDMKNPGRGHIAAYHFRDSTCDLMPWSCDSGFVHDNAGIVDRAHVLLVDGIFDAAGRRLTPGIGRTKMKRLMFVTMTRRLPSDARLNDAPVAERDICDMFVARGITDETGAAFTADDCDQITAAFNQVGLDGQLDTGWQEPPLGLSGSVPRYDHGETTSNGCAVANVVGELATPSGTMAIDLDPATPEPTMTRDAFNTQSIALRVNPGSPPPPLGMVTMSHTVDWRSVFGVAPSFATYIVPTPSCAPSVNRVRRVAAQTFVHDSVIGGSGTAMLGNASSSMPAASCVLRDANLELFDAAGNTMAGPGHAVLDRVTHFVLGIPVASYDQRAQIDAAPPGNGDLAAGVSWLYHVGRGPFRVRLVYTIDQVGGATCTP